MTSQLIFGDCLSVLPTLKTGSVDVVITDPPYSKEFEYLYGAVANETKRVLRVGGSFLTLCGHAQLPRVLNDISKHLKYRWIINYDQEGSYARLSMGVLVTWKPLLWFVNEKLSPRRCITDKAFSQKREKTTGHPWEQSGGYANWGLKYLTDTGQTVLDPFMGTGTTGLACIDAGRNFIGIEKDGGYFGIAEKRIHEAESRRSLME